MRTSELAVCTMDLFTNGFRHFWMGRLQGLLEKYPILEHAHQQDFYMLLFVEKAEGVIELDDAKIRLDGRKTIIIKPNCISTITINHEAKGELICFTEDFFSLRYNNNVLYQFSFLKRDVAFFIRLAYEQKEKLSVLLNLMQEEFDKGRQQGHKILRSYLNILLFELELFYAPLGNRRLASVKSEKVTQFEKLVEELYHQHKMPSEYARRLHITPNYLNKICKDELGQTAGEYIRKRIVIEAQRQLHYTKLSINEIADRLGFDSTSYFVTFFKKHTEATPEQFRKHS